MYETGLLLFYLKLKLENNPCTTGEIRQLGKTSLVRQQCFIGLYTRTNTTLGKEFFIDSYT